MEIQIIMDMMRVNEMQVRLANLGVPEVEAVDAAVVVNMLVTKSREDRLSDEECESLAASTAILLRWVTVAANCSGYPVNEILEDELCGR